jgi:hypothetical protein
MYNVVIMKKGIPFHQTDSFNVIINTINNF